MSVQAITWAYNQKVGSASLKFLLITLANHANREGLVFLSSQLICEETELNRKTVLAGISKLIEMGLIVDTGKTAGSTSRVKVYQMACEIVPKTGLLDDRSSSSKTVPKTGLLNSTENGTIKNETVPKTGLFKQSQKRTLNSTENGHGMVPKTDIPYINQNINQEINHKNITSTIEIADAEINKSEKKINSRQEQKTESKEDLFLAEQILSRIRKELPTFRQPNLKLWAKEIRLMQERDNRTRDEILNLFEWANSDSFWSTNILSPGKLREKWDELTLKRKRKSTNSGASNGNDNATARKPKRDDFDSYEYTGTPIDEIDWLR